MESNRFETFKNRKLGETSPPSMSLMGIANSAFFFFGDGDFSVFSGVSKVLAKKHFSSKKIRDVAIKRFQYLPVLSREFDSSQILKNIQSSTPSLDFE